MGRPRKIPKDTKKLKYLYFIVVLFQGKKVLKFGVSNNWMRRMTEYNNSNTVGYVQEILDVYISDFPKRIETMLKWWMKQVREPVYKYEYFDYEYYGLIRNKAFELADEFGIKMKKIE